MLFLKELILTGRVSKELWEGVVVLKELIFKSFYFERTDF